MWLIHWTSSVLLLPNELPSYAKGRGRYHTVHGLRLVKSTKSNLSRQMSILQMIDIDALHVVCASLPPGRYHTGGRRVPSQFFLTFALTPALTRKSSPQTTINSFHRTKDRSIPAEPPNILCPASYESYRLSTKSFSVYHKLEL